MVSDCSNKASRTQTVMIFTPQMPKANIRKPVRYLDVRGCQ